MKIRNLFLTFLLVFSLLPINVFAAQTEKSNTDTIHFSDGSYILIKTDGIEARAGYTKTGRRIYTYYSSTDVKKWEATLVATFIYDGTTCSCASSEVQVNILDSAWYIVSSESGKSANTATCKLTMGYKFLGITTTKKAIDMNITCDANGNLS